MNVIPPGGYICSSFHIIESDVSGGSDMKPVILVTDVEFFELLSKGSFSYECLHRRYTGLSE